jgi:NMD protein affecting ribosome stability and mRNA decay
VITPSRQACITVKDCANLKSESAVLAEAAPAELAIAASAEWAKAESAEELSEVSAELLEASAEAFRASRPVQVAAQRAKQKYFGLLGLHAEAQTNRRGVDAATQTSHTNLQQCPRCQQHFMISDLVACRLWGASSCIFPVCDLYARGYLFQ